MGNENLAVQISGIWNPMLAASDCSGAYTVACYHSCSPHWLSKDLKGQSLSFVFFSPISPFQELGLGYSKATINKVEKF